MKTTVLICLFCFVCMNTIKNVFCLLLKESPISQQTKCASSCPAVRELVCGSDGKTYINSCHLEKEACEKKSQVKADHPGSCDCPTSCMRHYKPVCAKNLSNGKERTYPNLCQYKRTACQMKKANTVLSFKRKGPCKKMSKCPSGCQDIFAPVCAADNKTYSSVCALKLASCNQNRRIGLLKIGRCQPGQCPEHCPFAYLPICGSDGRWHSSECELKLSACRKGNAIKRIKGKKSRRICGKKCVKFCPDDELPVCGTDGVTYGNECKLHKINCGKAKKVKVAKRAKCGSLPNEAIKKK